MRQFTHKDSKTTTFHMGGETLSFVKGICDVVEPTAGQLGWLDKKINEKLVVETTPKKKIKPSKQAAKKKGG